MIALVELDDPSHERPDRQKADAIKNLCVESAGLRLLRLNRDSHEGNALRQRVL